MKKHILTFLIFSLIHGVNAQKREIFIAKSTQGDVDTFKYEVNDPSAIRKIYIGINPLIIDLAEDNTIGAGLSLDYYFNNMILLHGDYFFPVYSDPAFGNKDLVTDELVFKRFATANLGGAFFPLTFIRESNSRIVLHSKDRGYERRVYNLQIPADRRSDIGGRIGYNYYAQSHRELPLDPEITISSFGAHSIYAGVMLGRIRNFSISSTFFKTRSRSYINNFYADILLAADINGEFYKKGSPRQRVDESQGAGLKTRKIGWRLGYETKWFGNGMIGGRVFIEGGSRPTFEIVEPYYLQFGIGLPIAL